MHFVPLRLAFFRLILNKHFYDPSFSIAWWSRCQESRFFQDFNCWHHSFRSYANPQSSSIEGFKFCREKGCYSVFSWILISSTQIGTWVQSPSTRSGTRKCECSFYPEFVIFSPECSPRNNRIISDWKTNVFNIVHSTFSFSISF